MPNYKIITDKKLLLEFIDWLPDLEKNEIYYVCLFARSKYQDPNNKTISHITTDKAQLKRFTSTKERLFSKIQQLECPIGAYKQYGVTKPTVDIPQETLALYITPNPRNVMKATKGCIKKFVDLIVDGNDHIIDPHRFAMSEIQRSKARTEYVDFDFDNALWQSWKDDINEILPKDSYKVLNTRGGFHLLVNPRLAGGLGHKWHQKLSSISSLDQSGDIMIPVPGTYQGGFTPYFEKL